MHPWHHAQSSQRRHGGTAECYLPLHNWFDASKAVLAHFTHRALRHHLEGIAEARAIFGDVLPLPGGREISVESLGREHLSEDMSTLPTAADWLAHLELPPRLTLAILPPPEAFATASSRQFGIAPESLLPLHQWFLATSAWFDDVRHLAMRHHSFGIFEAEARFGPIIVGDAGSSVPTRTLGEWHVRRVLGRVPSANEFLQRIKGQRWMAAAQSPSRLGLD